LRICQERNFFQKYDVDVDHISIPQGTGIFLPQISSGKGDIDVIMMQER